MERILLLESATSSPDILAARLRAEGFVVLAAEDPAEGVRLAAENAPDVIVINGRLPGREACDVIRQLRRAPPTRLLPTVQLVDSLQPDAMQGLLRDGADDCLAHPLDWPAFLFLLRVRARRWQEWNASYSRRIEQTRTQVVQALSHEVFHPLFEIEAGSEYLAHHCTCDTCATCEAAADTMHDIMEATQRLHRMLGKLMLAATLDQESADSGRKPQPCAAPAVDATSIVTRAALQTAQRYGRVEDIMFSLAPARVPIAAVDLGRIVEELVMQALSLSRSGSAVAITAQANPHYELAVSSSCAGDMDSACAQQGDEGVGPMATGLQIGLGIARRLAALHNGTFRLEESPRGELRAVVSLPGGEAQITEAPAALAHE